MVGAETGASYSVYKILTYHKSFNTSTTETIFGLEGWKRKKADKMQLGGGTKANRRFLS